LLHRAVHVITVRGRSQSRLACDGEKIGVQRRERR
jgi:hypothetical protein